jgi:hypothetical protein
LDRLLSRHRDTRLVVVDPVNVYMTDKDGNTDTEIRGVLNPLGKLAEKHRVAVVAVCHFSKGNSNASKDALQRVLGSVGYVGVARSVLAVIRNPDDDSCRWLLPVKNNVGPDRGNGLEYRLEQGDNGQVPKLAWTPGYVGIEAYEALERQENRESGDSKSKGQFAIDTILEVLADGPMPSIEFQKLVMGRGVKERTLDRAIQKSQGRVDSVLRTRGKEKLWYTFLAEHADRVPNDVA